MTTGEWLAEPIRILLVEDDEVDRRAVMRSIGAADRSGMVTVHQVVDAGSALAMLIARSFDCVLLDYHLPDGDALSLLAKWRASGAAGVPVVLLTGLEEEGIAIRALQEGAQDYLVKGSIAGGVLLRSIRHAIERFRLQSRLEKANEQLQRLAFLDPLTEMLNRRGLEHVLVADIGEASRAGLPLTSVLIDCDDFKSVNDTFGHDAGDLVLREVSSRIRGVLRTTDQVGRIGGDEFLVLLPATPHAQALLLAERIRQAVGERPISVASRTIMKTVSLGVFSVPEGTRSVTDILSHAHDALGRSKHSGKNRVSGTQGGPASLRSREANLADLRDFDALRVLSQPIFELASNTVVAHELLVQGAKGPLQHPEDLLAYCLRQNILTSIDLRCFQACVDAMTSLGAGTYHANLHWLTLLDTRAEVILAMIPDPLRGSVCIEASVQSMTGDPAKLTRTRAALREAGVKFALDQTDFGFGTLEALILLAPDMLKIDRSLVHSAEADPLKRGALARLARAAQAQTVDVVAVGIEDTANLEVMRTLDIKYGQGFLWGRPRDMTSRST